MRPILNIAQKNPYHKTIKYYNFYGVAMVLFFSLFSFWGLDWFHYLDFFESISITGENDYMEEVYVFIIYYLSPHYLFFRLWVWGLATFFLILTLKKTNVNLTVALFFFTTTWLLWFSYARVSLAMSITYFGASLIISESNKTNKTQILCGFILIFLSIVFHKSSVFGVIVVLISYIFYNKRFIVKTLPLYGALILIGILAITMNSLDTMTHYTDNERIGMMASVGQAYMDDIEGIGQRRLAVKMMIILERLPYYMMAVLSLFIVFGKQKKDTPRPIKFFAYILLLEVLYASVFALNYGFSTQLFYGRFLRFTFIPATIVLTHMYTEKKVFWLVRYTYSIAFLGVLYNLFYITLSTL